MNARERQLKLHRLLRALREHDTVTARIRGDLAQGLVVPSDVLALPVLAARVVAAAEPLWAGVDLAGPVTYEINETKEQQP
jgi:hypothetical protein